MSGIPISEEDLHQGLCSGPDGRSRRLFQTVTHATRNAILSLGPNLLPKSPPQITPVYQFSCQLRHPQLYSKPDLTGAASGRVRRLKPRLEERPRPVNGVKSLRVRLPLTGSGLIVDMFSVAAYRSPNVVLPASYARCQAMYGSTQGSLHTLSAVSRYGSIAEFTLPWVREGRIS